MTRWTWSFSGSLDKWWRRKRGDPDGAGPWKWRAGVYLFLLYTVLYIICYIYIYIVTHHSYLSRFIIIYTCCQYLFLLLLFISKGWGCWELTGFDAPKRNGFRIYSIYAKWGICMALYNLMIGIVPVIEWLCATETVVFWNVKQWVEMPLVGIQRHAYKPYGIYASR